MVSEWTTCREGDKPSFITANIRFEWYLDGVLRRDGDRPALI